MFAESSTVRGRVRLAGEQGGLRGRQSNIGSHCDPRSDDYRRTRQIENLGVHTPRKRIENNGRGVGLFLGPRGR